MNLQNLAPGPHGFGIRCLVIRCLVAFCTLALCLDAAAQVPRLINYQGRVSVGAVNFEGAGQFTFALVSSNGTTTFWSNDGSSEPAAAVTLVVTKGLYSVLLGDTALGNMTAVPAAAFTGPDVRLRVWSNDGVRGSQLLTPDQRVEQGCVLLRALGPSLPFANKPG